MTHNLFQTKTVFEKMDSEENKNCSIPVKQPKRILHFSDGTLEEFSDSEEETTQQEPVAQDVVDTAKLTWGPWLFHYIFQTGKVTLSACDYVGETLASFLGITTPKYQYELDEYERLQKEKAAQDQNEDNAKGWLKNTDNKVINENNIELHETS